MKPIYHVTGAGHNIAFGKFSNALRYMDELSKEIKPSLAIERMTKVGTEIAIKCVARNRTSFNISNDAGISRGEFEKAIS